MKMYLGEIRCPSGTTGAAQFCRKLKPAKKWLPFPLHFAERI
jgi:hypothetical protein